MGKDVEVPDQQDVHGRMQRVSSKYKEAQMRSCLSHPVAEAPRSALERKQNVGVRCCEIASSRAGGEGSHCVVGNWGGEISLD